MPEPADQCDCRCGKKGCAARRGHDVHKADYQSESQQVANHHRQQWTDSDLATVMRTDLTVRQIAETLGRTFYAVKAARHAGGHYA